MSSQNPKDSTDPKHSQNALEIILKTFGPSVFVTYFFTLGYLRNLKIAVAPTVNESLTFFISSILPSIFSELKDHGIEFLTLTWIVWLRYFLFILILYFVPRSLTAFGKLKFIPKNMRSVSRGLDKFIKNLKKYLLGIFICWIPGILLLWCLFDLFFQKGFDFLWALPSGETLPISRLTYVWAIFLALLWGPWSLYRSNSVNPKCRALNLGLIFLLMCGSSYYLADSHSGVFTKTNRIRLKNDELNNNSIVWNSNGTMYIASCPENGEWVMVAYEGGKEIFRNNLSRAKHSGICRSMR